MTDFRMPSLGADMDEGTVLEWRVAPGQAFAKGDVIVEVDTDKAAFEVEADADGTLAEILVQPGTTVPVGTVLARLAGGVAPPQAGSQTPVAPAPVEPPPPALAAAPSVPAAQSATPGATGFREHPRISPRARKRARELGVDISTLGHGSGVEGAIDTRDVEAAARSMAEGGAPQPTPQTARTPPASREARLRGVIAAAMSRSKREIPHYYLAHTIDMEPALTWLEAFNAPRPIGERVLPNVLLVKAVALGLDAAPELNGSWVDGSLRQQDAVHVGVAISLRGGGVLAPALHDVPHKPVTVLMAELADLVRRARAGRVRQREMTESTITVTSLGDRGTDSVTGVIFPPQVALVGFGTIRQRPWVVDGSVSARRVITATLAADHRASDGHRGALLLRSIADRLQRPQDL